MTKEIPMREWIVRIMVKDMAVCSKNEIANTILQELNRRVEGIEIRKKTLKQFLNIVVRHLLNGVERHLRRY